MARPWFASRRSLVAMGSKEPLEDETVVGTGGPRVMYVDTSNEPKSDEEAVSMCTKALGEAVEPGDIADINFNLGNAQERRGFGELAERAYRSCLASGQGHTRRASVVRHLWSV